MYNNKNTKLHDSVYINFLEGHLQQKQPICQSLRENLLPFTFME